MSYHGDVALGATLDLKFTTRQASGAPTTLAGTPVISAYVGNGTTEITAGITLTVDFDGRTGLNHVRVVATSGNGFATATDVELVITTGTVNSVSVVGEVIGSFSVENRSPLRPATSGRTLVVDAAGLADANAVKVGPTGAGTAQTARDLGASVLLAANQHVIVDSGVVTTLSNLPAAPTDWLTAAAVKADAVTKIQTGLSTYAGGDTTGTGTLLGRLTAPRAALLDNLDAAVTTRQASGVAVTLPANPPAGFLVAASYGTAPAWYTAPDNPSDYARDNVAPSWYSTIADISTASGNALVAATAAQVTADHGAGSYVRNTEPDNTTLAELATALELSGGNYRFTVAALANAPTGGGGGGDPWATAQPGTYAASTFGGLVAARLGALVVGPASFVGPVNPTTGEVRLVRGDDYLAAQGRALPFYPPSSGWPVDPTGGTVRLYLGGLAPIAALSLGPPLTFEVPHGLTGSLPVAGLPYAIRVAFAPDVVITLAEGHCRVLP